MGDVTSPELMPVLVEAYASTCHSFSPDLPPATVPRTPALSGDCISSDARKTRLRCSKALAVCLLRWRSYRRRSEPRTLFVYRRFLLPWFTCRSLTPCASFFVGFYMPPVFCVIPIGVSWAHPGSYVDVLTAASCSCLSNMECV